MSELINDALFLIWKLLPTRFLILTCKRVCRRWNTLISSDGFWKYYLETCENPTIKSWQWYAVSKVPVDIKDMYSYARVAANRASILVGSRTDVVSFNFPEVIRYRDVYEGEMSLLNRHGYGSVTHFDENEKITFIYRGEFRNNRREGYGVLTTPSMTYEGHFKGNNVFGHGVYRFNTEHGCEILSCEHDDGQVRSALYVWPDGRSYEGAVSSNDTIPFANGTGLHKWPDGSWYQGEWLLNKRWGYGTMTWADGTSWTGRWFNDRREDENLTPQRWDEFFRRSPEEMYTLVKEIMK